MKVPGTITEVLVEGNEELKVLGEQDKPSGLEDGTGAIFSLLSLSSSTGILESAPRGLPCGSKYLFASVDDCVISPLLAMGLGGTLRLIETSSTSSSLISLLTGGCCR